MVHLHSQVQGRDTPARARGGIRARIQQQPDHVRIPGIGGPVQGMAPVVIGRKYIRARGHDNPGQACVPEADGQVQRGIAGLVARIGVATPFE